ncbi:ProP effector [Caballeronia hypogeia]|uniref:ProP effector n=1 Tax=Caballeronia hypogeia TaxID=1777140 RepID=A0A157ZCZ1_9BURK|nr:ProQ/FinO family protein [Caballeronia hypogeia]SAK43390.1 ProP effector [Caballeronia hypogeia]
MGFEQLAALKKQLAQRNERAPAKKPAARPQRPAPATPKQPVDPVVHTIGKLQKQFPRAFPKNPAPKLPLKVGILEDLLKEAPNLRLTEKEVRDAIKTWCRGARYWSSLVEGAARVDLQGDAVGQVSAADAGRAQYLEAQRLARASSAPAKAKA